MARPEKRLLRDGTPVKEFAYWLRDLRSDAGLTYEQLGRSSGYATSTVQAATAGHRLPTWPVVQAIVHVCGGDESAWRTYWRQVHRLLDPQLPANADRTVAPPWLAAARDAKGDTGNVDSNGSPSESESWFVEEFDALLRLDVPQAEAIERRLIVAQVDGVAELVTSISVPRHPGDDGPDHGLEVELLHGGALELREHPHDSYFRHVIALPKPLARGQQHKYALQLRVPVGQAMAPHYVHVPFQRCERFSLRVRFSPAQPPRALWRVTEVPTAVIYERQPGSDLLTPDRFGEVHVEFEKLRVGYGYGVCWQY